MTTTTEAACYSTPEEAGLRVESLPFERIPNQSRLFLDYLRDPLALRKFYPAAVRYHHELAERKAEVLAAHTVDRAELCDALEAMNRRWGATKETLANIELLREQDNLAVVSGQQAGPFGGPLYTIYKALSAVKLAGCLTQRGTTAVPVFWIATEDHDFAEVETVEVIARDCRLAGVSVSPAIHTEGQPVGNVVLDESINDTIGSLLELLPSSEFTPDLEKSLREAYQPGAGYGDAFARLMTKLIGCYGLILLDPLDAKLKQLAAPLYASAAERAHQLAVAVTERSKELEAAGYHAQVVTSEQTFPLFIHTDVVGRQALMRTPDGSYQTRDLTGTYTASELSELAAREPQRFSPNVTLRSVVQDFLLPTVAYFGGAAEIAYFAQTAEVYRVLERPVTPILHRASMTLVEHHTWRTFERYGLSLSDLFDGYESVLARVVEEYLGKETAQTFNRVDASINRELDSLQDQLRNVDPTLADALETGRRKMLYQLDGLRSRFHRAQMNRDLAAQRQLERAFAALYPNKALQERHINITSLLARHGTYVVSWIYDAINLGSSDHQVVYL